MQPQPTFPPKSEADIAALMSVALGREAADLVVTNARLVNVYTAEIEDHRSVAVKGHWIAYVGPDAGHTVGPETEVIDAAGKTLIPGFIEGPHPHRLAVHGGRIFKVRHPGGNHHDCHRDPGALPGVRL